MDLNATYPQGGDATLDSASLSVSVIIATKDRTTLLGDMLRTLLNQTVSADQVVIIDQSKDDGTRLFVQSICSERRGSMRPQFVYVADATLRGAGAARNLGIERSSGAIFLFLDDDVLLERDFLKEVLAVYRTHSSVGGVSGMITNYTRPPFRQRLIEEVFCLGPFRDERLPMYWNADGLRGSDPMHIRKMSGCVMSVRRAALGSDRFDGSYRGAGAEDVDLSWRLSQRCPILLSARARLTHLRTQSGPKREHWLAAAAACQYYLYYRLWRTSITNFLCFVWLNCGFVLIATTSSIMQRSFLPYRALITGMKQCRRLLGG
jgi:glucosyl-dolichyl phosphate glucuronosyltransferase